MIYIWGPALLLKKFPVLCQIQVYIGNLSIVANFSYVIFLRDILDRDALQIIFLYYLGNYYAFFGKMVECFPVAFSWYHIMISHNLISHNDFVHLISSCFLHMRNRTTEVELQTIIFRQNPSCTIRPCINYCFGCGYHLGMWTRRAVFESQLSSLISLTRKYYLEKYELISYLPAVG